MIIKSITHCSASKNFPPEFKVSTLSSNSNFKYVTSNWSNIIENSKPKHIADNLYSGGGFKKLSKNLSDNSFYIVSAGLGLINSNTLIPSYECTVSRGKINSIVDFFNGEFNLDEWWKFLISTKYSSGSIHQITANADYIFISVTADYLKMIANDLKSIEKPFYIFTGSAELALELGFKKNLMPYNEVFDGPDGTLRGTNRDFPQRSHADFIRRLKLFNNNFEKAYMSVKNDMRNWRPPTKHNNAKKSDEEIFNLIKSHEGKFTKVSDLLHYFRYELKVACEEKRFKSLYKNFKEQRHV